MSVLYRDILGRLVAERSIEGIGTVMWTVQLSTGELVTEPMWQFVMLTHSVMEQVQNTPIEAYKDIP